MPQLWSYVFVVLTHRYGVSRAQSVKLHHCYVCWCPDDCFPLSICRHNIDPWEAILTAVKSHNKMSQKYLPVLQLQKLKNLVIFENVIGRPNVIIIPLPLRSQFYAFSIILEDMNLRFYIHLLLTHFKIWEINCWTDIHFYKKNIWWTSAMLN